MQVETTPPTDVAIAVAEPSSNDLEMLLVRESRRLFGIAVTILRDAGEAEDAVQEALTKAWSKSGGMRDPAATRAWLTKICVNHCISRRRKLLRLPLLLGSNHKEGIPSWYLEGRRLDLDRAYSTLTTRQRTATVLFYHYGYSIDECAQLMACAPGSVRSHLGRSLDKLRKEITDD